MSVTISRFLRRTSLKRRSSYLAVVVLPNETAAFQAYRLLHYHGISPEHLAIVGEGYSSPERVGLMQPTQIAVRKAMNYAIVSVIVGLVVGLVTVFCSKTNADSPLLLPLVILMLSIVCGICGAFVGAVFGFLGEGSTASIYRHHLNQGRYLLMMEGPEQIVRWGQDVLSHYSAPSPH